MKNRIRLVIDVIPYRWRLIFVTIFTSGRILLSPVVLTLSLSEEWVKALLILAISEFTEMFDGWLVGKLKVRTAFGSALDQIADIFMVCGAALGLILTSGNIKLWTIVAVILATMSLGMNATLNWLPKHLAGFKRSWVYSIIYVALALSSVGVQTVLFVIFTAKAGQTWILLVLLLPSPFILKLKWSRIDEWLEPLRQKRTAR